MCRSRHLSINRLLTTTSAYNFCNNLVNSCYALCELHFGLIAIRHCHDILNFLCERYVHSEGLRVTLLLLYGQLLLYK